MTRMGQAHGMCCAGFLMKVSRRDRLPVLYDRFPGFALLRVGYRNLGADAISIRGWVNGAHVLKPNADGGGEYWSFSGASYEDRRDWVQPVRPGFDQRNFMGMNASDYGGGTPVVDVWRRDYGLAQRACGNGAEAFSLPLTMTPTGARVAVECDQTLALAPGEGFSTFDSFLVAVHRGDYFATLDAYRRFLAERGMAQARVPAAAYAPIWCAWGYERTLHKRAGRPHAAEGKRAWTRLGRD